jgi:hypothetical protein
MSCFVMLSSFWQPLCLFVQPWFPMTRWLAVAAASAAADFMEVGLTSVAVPFTLDVTAGGALTCPARSQGTLQRGPQRVAGSTAEPLIAGPIAERPTVLQRLEPRRPAPLTMAATTTAVATATPTAIGSAQINIRIDARQASGRRSLQVTPPLLQRPDLVVSSGPLGPYAGIFWSIASRECGEIPSSANPGISGDDTVSICISST